MAGQHLYRGLILLIVMMALVDSKIVKRQAATTMRCPGTRQNFQDPTDCSNYYECVNDVVTRRSCPQGQVFNPLDQSCGNFPNPVGCLPSQAASNPTAATFRCPNPNGNFQDQTDCSRYWRCVNSVAIGTPCQAGQLFDTRFLQCSSAVTTVTGCVMPQTQATTGAQTFRCPNPTGNFQDHTDCSRYWRCVNSVPISTPCAVNQLFDTRALQCSSAVTFVAGCTMPSTAGAATTTAFRCQTPNGFFQDTTDCSRYWSCVNSRPTNLPCPANQYFNPAIAQCSTGTSVTGCVMPVITPPVTPETGSFGCPAPNGNYQDTTDCSRYWRCINNRATNILCADNQLFDPRTFQCSATLTTVNGCIMPRNRPPTPTVTGVFSCPTANGNYQDSGDCSRYWRCVNNQATQLNCPVNQRFDPRTVQCSTTTTVTGCVMISATGESIFMCPTPNGNYQDSTDCSRYWSCVNNQARQVPCPANQLYEPRMFQCSAITSVAGCVVPPNRPPPTTGTGSFVCPTPDGNYQDSTDCSRYWSCVNNQARQVPCPANQLYDPRTFQCIATLTTVAGCVMPPNWPPSTTGTGSFTCPTLNGNYQDVTDCSRYWRCSAGVASNLACPLNSLFDTRTNECSSAITSVAGCVMPVTGSATFVCPTPNGNYQDSTDCSRYWSCLNNQARQVPCPANQLYDPRMFRCSAITSVAGCVMPVTGSATFLCPTPSGEFGYPADCSQFWRCDRNTPVLRRCTGTLLFNAEKGYCDFPSTLGATPQFCRLVQGPAPPTQPVSEASCAASPLARNIPHPRICNAFYTCGDGRLFQPCTFCGDGTYFDPESQVCIHSSSVDLLTVCPGKVMMPHANKTQAQADGC